MIHLTSITAAMLDAEDAEGRKGIWPNNAPAWVDPSDWHGWPVLAIADCELHIIAIWSARKGALTRLIAGARADGLSPVIVAPMGQMYDILTYWGWSGRVTGKGWDEREEWRPNPLPVETPAVQPAPSTNHDPKSRAGADLSGGDSL